MALMNDGGSAKKKTVGTTGFTMEELTKMAQQEADQGLGGPAWSLDVLMGGGTEEKVDPIKSLFDQLAADMAAAQSASAANDRAAQQFAQDLALKQFEFEKEQFEYQKASDMTDKLLEAAGLAVGPAGAIQLAFMARGQGTPNEKIREIFSTLPFVQALNRGETLPGFGLPEQLGGETARTTNTTGTGGTFGLNLVTDTGMTEQSFQGLSDFEKVFLGQLYQAETGIDAKTYLESVQKSFIPTTSGFSVF